MIYSTLKNITFSVVDIMEKMWKLRQNFNKHLKF